jgi:hypothetical protein
VAVAATIAILRTILVPVGSFGGGLESLTWGMSADSVGDVLGEPNRICATGRVDHVPLTGPDSSATRRVLRDRTAERWVYTRRAARRPIPRDPDSRCRAPSIATELGFDAEGRLRWYVREMNQTPLEFDPALIVPAPRRN